MLPTLESAAMAVVFREAIPYDHLAPHPVVMNLTELFFRDMYEEMGDHCFFLSLGFFMDPNSSLSAEDMAWLLNILKTFGVVSPKHGRIQPDKRLQASTIGLLSTADWLMDRVPTDLYHGFLKFLESVIVRFIDKSYILPSIEEDPLNMVLDSIRNMKYHPI